MLYVTNAREKTHAKTIGKRTGFNIYSPASSRFQIRSNMGFGPQGPRVAEKCRRQSPVVANDSEKMRDLEMLTEIADWCNE